MRSSLPLVARVDKYRLNMSTKGPNLHWVYQQKISWVRWPILVVPYPYHRSLLSLCLLLANLFSLHCTGSRLTVLFLLSLSIVERMDGHSYEWRIHNVQYQDATDGILHEVRCVLRLHRFKKPNHIVIEQEVTLFRFCLKKSFDGKWICHLFIRLSPFQTIDYKNRTQQD